MGVRYNRCLGRVGSLDPGEWTDRTDDGAPAIRCKSCGAIFGLPESHRVIDDGRIVPALRCPTETCSAYGYVTLGAYREDVLR